jgi:F-type H+-transporting ATPase subunit a
MEASPLVPDILFHIGFVPISRSVVTTWAIMALLFVVLRVSLRAPKVNAGPTQAAL